MDRHHERHSGGRPAQADAGSVLVIASAARLSVLRSVLAGVDPGALELSVAESAAEAAERFAGAGVDVVLLDLAEPGPGLESVAEVRAAFRGASLVVAGSEGDMLAAVQRGADVWVDREESSEATVARCVLGVVERHTERAALEECESRFTSIVERTADAIVVVDADGRMRFVNPAAETLFGRSRAELVGRELGGAVIVGETAEIDILRAGEAEPIVAELRASDTIWDGEPAQIISLRDMTDRRRAEERAQQLLLEHSAREHAEREGQRFRFLAEASAELDSSLDPDTTLRGLAHLIVPRVADWCVIDLVAGSRIRRVAGVHSDPDKQPLLEELRERFAPRPDRRQPAGRVMGSGGPELHRHLDRERVMELAVNEEHADLLLRLGIRSSMTVPLETQNRRIGAITFVCDERDFDENDVAFACEIASRAARALENARLYDAALAANRAKADFLAVMSHELRTPLNAVLGYTDLLLTGIGGEGTETRNAYLKRIRATASELLQIIEQILAYAASETEQTATRSVSFSLEDVVDEVAAVIEPLARSKGIAFVIELSQPEATLETDREKLRQIMLNLLANAVKFTEEGTVTLRARAVREEVELAVIDTGVGIASDELERIFEPFRQVDGGTTRSVGGTGLGLSVSRRLARLLGGDIRVESGPGQGSRFFVRVPRRLASTAVGRR